MLLVCKHMSSQPLLLLLKMCKNITKLIEQLNIFCENVLSVLKYYFCLLIACHYMEIQLINKNECVKSF